MSELAERLNSTSTPDQSDVLAYLEQRRTRAAEQGLRVWEVDDFIRDGDLGQYQQARAWWPEDASGMLACPPLTMLLDGVATGPMLEPQTFVERLMDRTNQVVAWLEAQGRDPRYVNEAPDERRRRLNRERVARHRAGAEQGERSPSAVAWDAVQEARRVRAAVRSEHDDRVRAAYDHMMELSEERRLVVEEQDRLVAAAEAEHARVKGAGPADQDDVG